jgi:hypothetical protein
MQVTTFAELASELQHVDEWLCDLGFRKHDRLREVMRIVEDAAAGIARARVTGEPAKIGRSDTYHFGVSEAAELADVWRAFRDAQRETIRPILQRALQGPARSRDERKETAHARNSMFELALAAEWKLLGGKVHIGEPDITLSSREAEFAIECKRPFGEHSIRSNVKGAAEQLEGKLDRDESRLGVIAVSVSRVLDDGRRLLISDNLTDVAQAGIESRVTDLYKSESKRWSTTWFHPRVTAILFHARVIGTTKEHSMNRFRSTVLGPAAGKGSPTYDGLAAELARLYPENVTLEP